MSRSNSPFALTYSILAGPIVWFSHFIAVYIITEFGCRANFVNRLFISPANIQLVIVIATIISLVAVGSGGVLAHRYGRTWHSNHKTDKSSETLIQFLVIVGLLLSALFLFAIVMTAAPTIFLPACDQAT